MTEESSAGTATAPTRAGFAALIGEPNVGKSTLLNSLVGIKVSIVTHKVQTTRGLIRGVAISGSAQIVFVDTPGLFAPKRRLDRAMGAAAWSGATEADAIALLIEAQRGLSNGVLEIMARLKEQARPKQTLALIVNKIDRVKREELLALAAAANEHLAFSRTFFISAMKGDGVEDFKTWLAGEMPLGPWLYPEDQIADAPMRHLAAEITREKLMLRLHEELPYQMTVETDRWEEKPDGSARVEQTIYVAREGHRPIVLGKGGQTLKQVGQAARKEIGELAGRTIHLFLHVKLKENWLDDPERYRAMGLDFKSGS